MNAQLLRFVEEQAAKLNRNDIVALASRLPALRERFFKLDSLDYPELTAQYNLLAAVVEDCGENLDGKLPDECHREAAFALLYLEAHGDLVPEGLPGIGFTDDQAIVGLVLHKHRRCLQEGPRGYLFRWDGPPADFDETLLQRLHRRLEWMRQDGLTLRAKTDHAN